MNSQDKRDLADELAEWRKGFGSVAFKAVLMRAITALRASEVTEADQALEAIATGTKDCRVFGCDFPCPGCEPRAFAKAALEAAAQQPGEKGGA